ncbi:LOW QUALITY PROTEIN: hypothetical protein PHMEG_00016564 [Phytophthora megakarya]|uniref:Uncharacterized protein n=1 Tax=Phytophthora megakarya TaxID=4795 RepID=A0A225VYI5_9STRA|nr:LOW QUALITY PROTEIN: hypothetical protein PHMEG_00016564 [Phytophthora megakarya]
MSYSGSTERCAHHRRTHRWNGRLPRDLQEFIDRNYGHDRRQHSRNHRAWPRHCTSATTMSPHGTHLSVQSAYAARPRAAGHRDCGFVRDGQQPAVPDIPSSDSTAPNPILHTCAYAIRPQTTRRAFFPITATTRHLASNAAARSSLREGLRLRNINAVLNRVELSLPVATPMVYMGVPSLNTALQRVLSKFVRRSNITLPHFFELMATNDDYRPNKRMILTVLDHVCEGYRHVDALVIIAKFGARAPLVRQLARQHPYPKHHKSTDDRYPVLVKNTRKEQDNWRCLRIRSPPGRVIHDLSFPDGLSVNDLTDTASICTPEFQHCDAIATEILQPQEQYPDAEILLQAGDVNAAFWNVCTHSTSAYLFGGRLIRDNALIIDTAAAFGWPGSPTNHGGVGGATAYSHGNSASWYRPAEPFNYYWVDDHFNVAANVGTNCSDVEQSLRRAMITVLGHGAINEDKFTSWSSRQKLLGLVFDSAKSTVVMPVSKIHKAKTLSPDLITVRYWVGFAMSPPACTLLGLFSND